MSLDQPEERGAVTEFFRDCLLIRKPTMLAIVVDVDLRVALHPKFHPPDPDGTLQYTGLTHYRYLLVDTEEQAKEWVHNFYQHPCYQSGHNTVRTTRFNTGVDPCRYAHWDSASKSYWRPFESSWVDLRDYPDNPRSLDPWAYLKKEENRNEQRDETSAA